MRFQGIFVFKICSFYFRFRFADDIEFMTGKRPWSFWLFCWKYLSPFALIVILIWTLVDLFSKTPSYSAYVGCTQVSLLYSSVWAFIQRFSRGYCNKFMAIVQFNSSQFCSVFTSILFSHFSLIQLLSMYLNFILFHISSVHFSSKILFPFVSNLKIIYFSFIS